MIQRRNLWTALSTSLAAYSLTVYRYIPGRQREGEVGADKKVRGKDRQNPEWKEKKERSGAERRGEEGITQSFLRRERGMNIPILPCSLETAASSFGGKHCLCLFPAWLFAWCIPQFYIQWWERWRSGRLTMRPKGHRGKHSQLYSMHRSKATLLYPKLVTISQSLQLPSNITSHLHSSKTRLFSERLDARLSLKLQETGRLISAVYFR